MWYVNYISIKLLPLKGQFLDSAYELDYASIHPEGYSSWDTHIKNIWPVRNTGEIGASLYLETSLILWVWWQESSYNNVDIILNYKTEASSNCRGMKWSYVTFCR